MASLSHDLPRGLIRDLPLSRPPSQPSRSHGLPPCPPPRARVPRRCLLLLLPVQVVMREGAVLESGSHAQLLQRDGAYAQLVKLQPSL